MHQRTYSLTSIALMAALMAIFSQISIPIPISPVPLTLQTAGIIIAPIILGAKRGTLSILAYILIGVCGVPVFSAGKAGLSVLVGPTGGYLLGFVLGTLLAGLYWQTLRNKNLPQAFVVAVISITVTMACGLAWFSFLMGMSLSQGFLVAVLPFLPLDVVKIIIFAPVAYKVRRALLLQFPHNFS